VPRARFFAVILESYPLFVREAGAKSLVPLKVAPHSSTFVLILPCKFAN
jgi:hypothetical protein